MTRARSLPIVLVSLFFDALRLVFNWFWFFGPLLVGAGVGTLVGSVAGTTLGTAAGAVAGLAAGAGIAVFETIGIMLAFLTDLLGWLTVWLLLMILNHRIFKANGGSLSVLLGIIIGGIPFIGSIPVQSVMIWRMYGVQIKNEREDLQRWEQENAIMLIQQRRDQATALQARAEQRAAYDNSHIPEDTRGSA